MFRARSAKTSPRPSCGPTSSTSTRKGTRRTSPSRWKAWRIKSNIKFRGSTFCFNINCYSYIKGIFFWKKMFLFFSGWPKTKSWTRLSTRKKEKKLSESCGFQSLQGMKGFHYLNFFFFEILKRRIYLRVLVNLNLKVFACCANNAFFLVHWIINLDGSLLNFLKFEFFLFLLKQIILS